ncbi:hypothetical protein [Streptomyces deccanensis]|uniref:hypothetical protein n=1 Tax=Streptomyces deccanensis TaxID=424188 RepID=UPI001EFAEDE3|nr:hypothetical protein [Streptomyces deccanensis]ULR47890.1 hypothetical protein L3078_00550 [Streptomyces deccanensis]
MPSAPRTAYLGGRFITDLARAQGGHTLRVSATHTVHRQFLDHCRPLYETRVIALVTGTLR